MIWNDDLEHHRTISRSWTKKCWWATRERPTSRMRLLAPVSS